MDDIKSEDICRSLSLEHNKENVFNAGEGAGASGSFFFFTHDRRYLIKTLQKTE